MQTTDSAPDGILDAIWPVIAPALTPEMVGAIIVTLAATHAAKIVAEALAPQVTRSARAWRAFCVSASLAIGALVGLVTWLMTVATWPIVPIVAVCSGPAWVLVKALIPRRLAHIKGAFMTVTDRKYQRREP